MAEKFLDLSDSDRFNALAVASDRTGRPAHLLEKDVWVVWILRALCGSPIADGLTFKGGTSLSKAYKVIDRFSEDVDLTYDIRRLLPEIVMGESSVPTSRAQADRWTRAVRKALPVWITETVQPILEMAIDEAGVDAELVQPSSSSDQLVVRYGALSTGTGYVAPHVTLEFGARATGEPRSAIPITTDIAAHMPDLEFPTATPHVMLIERTFWEKATAAHVYCAQDEAPAARFARHWFDLSEIAKSAHFDACVNARDVANAVAIHKSYFFREKDSNDEVIDYKIATSGGLSIVPEGAAYTALEVDFEAMTEDRVLLARAVSFDSLMDACKELEKEVNRAAFLRT